MDTPTSKRVGAMKCQWCKRKVGLVVFTCVCERQHCAKCRLPEVHECPVKVETKVDLPKVVAPKIEKI